MDTERVINILEAIGIGLGQILKIIIPVLLLALVGAAKALLFAIVNVAPELKETATKMAKNVDEI